MQKAAERILPLLGKVIFIGLCIQIVLGIVWMCLNFASFQEFGDSFLYVQISDNLICDEYTGILYPVFLLLAKGVEKMIRLPYYCVAYSVQILAALYAAHTFLRKLKKTSRLINLWGSLVILTIPMAMQCHLAVLPNSFAASFFLLEISGALEIIRTKETAGWRQLVKPFFFWLMCALLMPEYLYLGAVPALFVLLCELARSLWARGTENFRKKAVQLGAYALLGMAVVGMTVGINGLTQVRGYYGKVEKSLEAAMVSRFAWTSLEEYYDAWPEEVRAAVDLGKMRESAYYPDNMARVFGPLMEEAFGTEQAKEYFVQLSRMAWEREHRKILHEIAWDVAGYTLSPVALQMQLTGRGYDAYSGRNYEIMRHHTPAFTRIYLDYSCWWFGAGLCVTAVMQLVWALKAGRLPCGRTVLSFLLVACSCGAVIVWYTLRGAGMMDYKLSISVSSLWILWSVLVSVDFVRGAEKREI